MQDHPRSRGVYFNRYFALRGAGGSSPLARGLRDEIPRKRYFWRIIPARAGFTEIDYEAERPVGDHPRSRGVYKWVSDRPGKGEGSSPLARGLHTAHHSEKAGFRIIPARAGFTAPGPATWSRLTDHPRSRGVYARTCTVFPQMLGSSPLARGLPH